MCRTAARASSHDRYVHTAAELACRGWDGSPQANTCVRCVSNKVVLCGHVPSMLASCCKATRYNYINQRSQPDSFQRGGRHSVYAETFPRAAISGRCWCRWVDLQYVHRSGHSQGQPWPNPGPKEIAHYKVNQQGGGAGGRDIRPALVLFSPVHLAPWPIGLG